MIDSSCCNQLETSGRHADRTFRVRLRWYAWIATAAWPCLTIVVWHALGLGISMAKADEFVLKDGRTIRGNLKSERNVESLNDKQLVVEMRGGVMLLINGKEIKQHIRASDNEREYFERMKQPLDTIEFHLEMAGWCHAHGLSKYEVAHFERVLELDSENEVARGSLDYIKGKDGRWVKRDQLMTEARGKVREGGKYRFPELIAIEEAEKQANVDRKTLMRDIVKWQNDVINNTIRANESMGKLQGLAGPQVSAALGDLLLPKSPTAVRPPDTMRLLYVDVLTRLADPVAVRTLVRLSLADQSPAVRELCLERVRTLDTKAAAAVYMQALRSDNPDDINAAGRALGVLQEPTAILPLIERLVTRHVRTTPGSNATNMNFNSEGSYTMGQAKPKNIALNSSNQGVLDALVSITGENFQYEKAAWLAWYEQSYLQSASDLRRDP